MTQPTEVGAGDQAGAGDTTTFPVTAGGTRTGPEPQHDADRIRAVALAVPGVAGLHGGTFGEAATYLPGRRVSGVRMTGDATAEVHVVLTLDVPVLATAARVRDAVATVMGGRVDVVVEDVVEPGPVPALAVTPGTGSTSPDAATSPATTSTPTTATSTPVTSTPVTSTP